MVVIVMGVSGSGKTTVGRLLAKALGWTFRDGDEFHSRANIEKMAAGHELSDEDRAPWLTRLRAAIEEALGADRGLVLACSALKEAYRERLTVDVTREHFVFLHASRELLARRVAARRHHFMPPSLLDSQLATLEVPRGACEVDVSVPPDEVVARVLEQLKLPAALAPAPQKPA